MGGELLRDHWERSGRDSRGGGVMPFLRDDAGALRLLGVRRSTGGRHGDRLAALLTKVLMTAPTPGPR